MSSPTPLTQAQHDALVERTAMLFMGDEVYGIGTILRLYALGLPKLSFVALGEGPMVDWLRANGNRVDVVPGLVRFEEGGPSVITVAKMPFIFPRAWASAARIDRLLRPRGIRIIHAHWRPQQIISGFLRKWGYRTVWQINNTMNPRRLFSLGAKLNHALGHWGADLLLPASDAIGVNWNGCGVPSITIRNAATPLFPQPNILPETPVRCLVAGRLEHSKGHHLAVAAVINARAAGFDVHLDVYGGPLENNAYADELRQQIAAAGCQDAIQLKGFDAKLRQKHQQYHLGLQCRIDPEPCSLWVCETLVDGLPLVASATGGTPELVEDGATGLLFRTDDVPDFTDKLLSLLRDPARLREMRALAFARGQQKFTLDRFVRETLDAYTTIPGLPETLIQNALWRIENGVPGEAGVSPQ
jgi:glycosyltransferase involved in cell wall biosynthesis